MEVGKYYKVEKDFPQKDVFVRCLAIKENEYNVQIIETEEEISISKNVKYDDILIDNQLELINKLISIRGYLLHPVFIFSMQKSEIKNYSYECRIGLMGYFSLVSLEGVQKFIEKHRKVCSEYQKKNIDSEEIIKTLYSFCFFNELFDKLEENGIKLRVEDKKFLILNNHTVLMDFDNEI